MKLLPLFAALALCATPLGAGQTLVVVAPHIILAPGHLEIQTLVEPDAANGAIRVVAESADFYRASEIELRGQSAPRTSTFEYRDLPAGQYTIQATLFDSHGESRALATGRVDVVLHVR